MSEKLWTPKCAPLVGRRIVSVEYMPRDAADKNGWTYRPIVLHLDDGTALFPMRDDEGNDAGALATSRADLPTIPVMR